MLHQVGGAFQHGRIVPPGAEILAAQESDGGHGGRGRIAGEIGESAAAALRRACGRGGAEKGIGALERGGPDLQAGHLGALEGHDLPAGDGQIALVARAVAPAAGSRKSTARCAA